MVASVCSANQTRTTGPLAARLRHLREGLGLTKQELARKARMHKDVIYRLESGKQTALVAEKAQRLCAALGCPDLFSTLSDTDQECLSAARVPMAPPQAEPDASVVPTGATRAAFQLRLHGREVSLTLTDTDDSRLMERLTAMLTRQSHTTGESE